MLFIRLVALNHPQSYKKMLNLSNKSYKISLLTTYLFLSMAAAISF